MYNQPMLRHRLLTAVAIVFALALPFTARAQSESYFGPQVGVFMPQDQALRDALGDQWFSFGASRIRLFRINESKLAFDWNGVGQSKDGSTVFIFTGSFGYVIPFSSVGSSTQPYAALRAGAAYMDYAVETSGGRVSGKRLGANANAALGMNFSDRFNVEVRYDVWSEFDGLSFNGLTLAARIGLFRF